ncbi:hypothetical protein J0H58_36035 [bacterium]|nr:hypothetical protein [bacterium]
MPRLFIALASALFVVGCSGDGREAVSGSIKLKGQPLPEGGVVKFEPLEKQGTEGLSVVSAGKYSIPRENGLKPGRYVVRVSAGDGKTAVNPVNPDQPPGPGGGANIVSKNLVPAEWGRNSKQEVTVTPGGRNEFNFEIP